MGLSKEAAKPKGRPRHQDPKRGTHGWGQVRALQEPSEKKKWLRSLQAWVVQAGRKPNLLSEDAVERRQARRWQNAARCLDGSVTLCVRFLFCGFMFVIWPSCWDWAPGLRLKHTDNPSTMLNEASRLQLFGLETVQPRYLQHGRLDEAEQQVFASCQRVNLQNRKQLRDWLQDRSKLWKLMFF